jgi:hypothetical protein
MAFLMRTPLHYTLQSIPVLNSQFDVSQVIPIGSKGQLKEAFNIR